MPVACVSDHRYPPLAYGKYPGAYRSGLMIIKDNSDDCTRQYARSTNAKRFYQ